MRFETSTFFTRVFNYAKTKLYSFYISILMPFSYAVDPELRHAYNSTLHSIDNPKIENINQSLHESSSRIAVENYKIQKNENITEIFQSGKMWRNIIDNVTTYKNWNSRKDDSILYDALHNFYRSDLILSHSGDTYIWDIKNGSIDLKLQVFMLIRRYHQFISNQLSFDKNLITTTDIGQNIYVDIDGKKITFKMIRFAYYLDRILKQGLLPSPHPVIGELGSGAGEMTILTKKVIPGCRYICFDLPETLMVASYNILMTYPELKIGVYNDFRDKKKIGPEDIREFDIILLPNWCIERFEDQSIDLFINVGSLSEMDPPIIENYLNHIERITSGFLYTVNRNIKGATEFGSEDIPLEEFPFSDKAKLIHSEYDKAADIYHQRYGMDYQCNYWEFLFKME